MSRGTSRSRAEAALASEGRSRPPLGGDLGNVMGRRAGTTTPGAAARFLCRRRPFRCEPVPIRRRLSSCIAVAARGGPADRRFVLATREIFRPLRDGVRGVTAAREIVNLEAPGSTPAEYPRPRIGMCSWESSESPKLAHRVRILASLLFVSDRVSSPWSVTESHATLRRSQTRFDSWRGHRAGRLVAAGSASILPASVSEARRSSKPQGRVRFPGGGFSVGTISSPRSVTDSHTTLRRSGTRFNSWRGHRLKPPIPSSIDRPMTLEPDGQATGCNPVQVGSTPTGVSAHRPNPLG